MWCGSLILFWLAYLTIVEARCCSDPPTTRRPSGSPTFVPSRLPSADPTRKPSRGPTPLPTRLPSVVPTRKPSRSPTIEPSEAPSNEPTYEPSQPSSQPSSRPTTFTPRPSFRPSLLPTPAPSFTPQPTTEPTILPTKQPSAKPTLSPSSGPSAPPSRPPTQKPSTAAPSERPTTKPSASPSRGPTLAPSLSPTEMPTISCRPTIAPSAAPTESPTLSPSTRPSASPSLVPTMRPSPSPTPAPSTAIADVLTVRVTQVLQNIDAATFQANPANTQAFTQAVAESLPRIEQSDVSVASVSDSPTVRVRTRHRSRYLRAGATEVRSAGSPLSTVELMAVPETSVEYVVSFVVQERGFDDGAQASDYVQSTLRAAVGDGSFAISLARAGNDTGADPALQNVTAGALQIVSSEVVVLRSAVPSAAPTFTPKSSTHVNPGKYSTWPDHLRVVIVFFALFLFIVGFALAMAVCYFGDSWNYCCLYCMVGGSRPPAAQHHEHNDESPEHETIASAPSAQEEEHDHVKVKQPSAPEPARASVPPSAPPSPPSRDPIFDPQIGVSNVGSAAMERGDSLGSTSYTVLPSSAEPTPTATTTTTLVGLMSSVLALLLPIKSSRSEEEGEEDQQQDGGGGEGGEEYQDLEQEFQLSDEEKEREEEENEEEGEDENIVDIFSLNLDNDEEEETPISSPDIHNDEAEETGAPAWTAPGELLVDVGNGDADCADEPEQPTPSELTEPSDRTMPATEEAAASAKLVTSPLRSAASRLAALWSTKSPPKEENGGIAHGEEKEDGGERTEELPRKARKFHLHAAVQKFSAFLHSPTERPYDEGETSGIQSRDVDVNMSHTYPAAVEEVPTQSAPFPPPPLSLMPPLPPPPQTPVKNTDEARVRLSLTRRGLVGSPTSAIFSKPKSILKAATPNGSPRTANPGTPLRAKVAFSDSNKARAASPPASPNTSRVSPGGSGSGGGGAGTTPGSNLLAMMSAALAMVMPVRDSDESERDSESSKRHSLDLEHGSVVMGTNQPPVDDFTARMLDSSSPGPSTRRGRNTRTPLEEEDRANSVPIGGEGGIMIDLSGSPPKKSHFNPLRYFKQSPSPAPKATPSAEGNSNTAASAVTTTSPSSSAVTPRTKYYISTLSGMQSSTPSSAHHYSGEEPLQARRGSSLMQSSEEPLPAPPTPTSQPQAPPTHIFPDMSAPSPEMRRQYSTSPPRVSHAPGRSNARSPRRSLTSPDNTSGGLTFHKPKSVVSEN